MSQRISQTQLESYLWGAAVHLRGTIDAGDYKQFIFPLLFFKRLCDVFDEETQVALAESGGDAAFAAYPEIHRFQVPEAAHWRTVRQVAVNVGQALQTAMRAIESANQEKLYGIFGDAQWTNKERLPDSLLRDLMEHFSTLDLTLANLPEDELGQGYEFLIKKFADDSGHTAAEFYTNRTVVHLMTEMLQPQPGESIYDPTCGSGGMLLSSIAHLRRQGKEWRNVRLYGQERNLMTSSIARMNCFLHGIEDFQIMRGDTLAEPKLVEGDRLKQFDLVLANPPYSIKQWDRGAFASDKWGRNLYGTPPQGRADYAFWQHIIASMKHESGRCAILFPHGVLFRQEEAEMRRKMIEADVIECVLGLGPNLFYNSPMEACVVICRTAKPKERQGKILFINAVNEVTRERGQSFLTAEHIERTVAAYREFQDEPGFTQVATLAEIQAKGGSLSIPLYVESTSANGSVTVQDGNSLVDALDAWASSRVEVVEALKQILPEGTVPALEELTISGELGELFTNREGWTRVRFGDVVENINETESDPEGAGIERFIGLEHLEPGSLHVRSWGNVADGTTFTRRCRPGQVLFGKRRAYQRKVAVAEFEAVVSGDIYVLAPRDERLVPELLPYICMSERFFQHAVGTSAGSLSPRTNWSSLADFEFDLPPVGEQGRIASVLRALDETQQHHDRVMAALKEIENALVGERLQAIRSGGEMKALGSVADVSYGLTLGGRGDLPEERPYLRVANVQRNWVDLSEVKTVKCTPSELERYSLAGGDVLVVEGHADVNQIGRAAMWQAQQPDMLHQNHLLRVRCSSALRPEYLTLFLNSNQGRGYMRSRAKSTSGLNTINSTVLKDLLAPVPPLEEQDALISAVQRSDATLKAIRSVQDKTKEIVHYLVNEVVS